MRQYRQHGRPHQGEESKERRMDEIKDVADSLFGGGGGGHSASARARGTSSSCAWGLHWLFIIVENTVAPIHHTNIAMYAGR